jgi:CRP-like cAMP-binding protein
MMDTASALQRPTLRTDHAHMLAHEGRPQPASGAFGAALQSALPGRTPLPADAVDELATLARQRHCAAGALLVRRGQPAEVCWLMGSGRVALGVLGPHGVLEHVRSMQTAGWLDPGSVLLGGSYVEDVVCEMPSSLWQMPAAALRLCCARHPALMSAMADALAHSVQQLKLDVRVLMTKDVQARCATWLLEHATPGAPADGKATAEVELNQRKRSVALQLSTTPETFSRVLSQLRSKGLIAVQGYRITLLDLVALRKLAEA